MRSSIALCATLLVGCTGTGTGLETPKPWELRGAYDLARVQVPAVASPDGGVAEPARDHLYILSSERDQLHVLDMTNNAKRDYVRAPNPIEPLAIPVLREPMRVVSDTRYVEVNAAPNAAEPRLDYREEAGTMVYAYNPSTPDVSIVNGRDAKLRQVHLLSTSGPVTAVTARGGAMDQDSTLYFAIRDGADAKLFAVTVPTTPGADYDPVIEPAAPLLTVPGEAITALLTLPPAIPGATDESIVVATRGPGGTGSTFVYDRTTGNRVTLEFPAPVRLLRTHGASLAASAGSRIFGILDETACDGGDACRGILAVNRGDGRILNDSEDLPMLPIVNGDALPVSLTLVPYGQVGRSSQPYSLLGIVSYAGPGDADRYTVSPVIMTFDAIQLRILDSEAGGPFPGTSADPASESISYLNAAGEVLDTATAAGEGMQLTGLQLLSEGAVRTENMAVAYEGRVPGLDRLPLDPAAAVPSTFTFDPAFVAPCPDLAAGLADPDPERCIRVRPGDLVVLDGACTDALEVTSVAAGTLTTSAPAPTCTSASSWTVRARGARPFVVSGSETGFMGRAAVNALFQYYGPHFYRPNEFNPALPGIQFTLGPNPAGIDRDYRYSVRLNSGVSPQWFSFTSGTGQRLGFDVNPFPTTMVYRCAESAAADAEAFPCNGAGIRRLYIAFPALPDVAAENIGWLGEFEAAEMFENDLSAPGTFFP